jgi:hypothetical protein
MGLSAQEIYKSRRRRRRRRRRRTVMINISRQGKTKSGDVTVIVAVIR